MTDFFSLANLAKPQLPSGTMPSGYAGSQYQQQFRQHQNLLGLATNRAMQEQEEFDMTRPTRMAQDALTRANAEEGLKDLTDPTNIELKIAEKIKKLNEAKKAELEEKAHIFGAISQAKSPDEVKGILDMFGNDAIFRGKDLRQMNPEQAIQISKGIMAGLKMTPKYMQAIDQQALKNQGFRDTATIRARSAERVAAIQAAAKEASAQIQAASAEQRAKLKPENLEQFIVSKMKELEAAGASPKEILDAVQPLIEQLKELKKRPDNTGGLLELFGNRGQAPSVVPAPAKTTPKQKVKIGDKEYELLRDNGDGTGVVMHEGKERKVRLK